MSETIKLNKKIIFGIALLALLAGIFIGNYQQIKETIGYSVLTNNDGCKSSVSTSTPNFMTPGTGTTTVQCNTGNDESMRAFVSLIASSTQTNYGFQVSRSMDGKSYYEDSGVLQNNATNTPLLSYSRFSHVFASTSQLSNGTILSQGFGGNGTTSVENLNFSIPTMGASHVRLTSFLIDADPAGQTSTSSDNGAVHIQLIPSRNTAK